MAAGTVCKDSKVCVSRFITIVKGVYVTTTSPCSCHLRLSKFSGSIRPPGVMRAQFRLIIKHVAGLRRSTRARRITRIKYAITLRCVFFHAHCNDEMVRAPDRSMLSGLNVFISFTGQTGYGGYRA